MADTQPTQQHHFNLSQFLQILLALAPAIAAPFIKSPGGQAVLQAETPIAAAIAQVLAEQAGGSPS